MTSLEDDTIPSQLKDNTIAPQIEDETIPSQLKDNTITLQIEHETIPSQLEDDTVSPQLEAGVSSTTLEVQHLMEDQLQSPSLLRLWRTGAFNLMHSPHEHEEDIDVSYSVYNNPAMYCMPNQTMFNCLIWHTIHIACIKLSNCLQRYIIDFLPLDTIFYKQNNVFSFLIQLTQFIKPGEYGLSKDVDVSLWVESRIFRSKPPIQEVFDFVIVDAKLHAEFDKFKEEETDPDYSLLSVNELLHYWNMNERLTPAEVIIMYGKPHLKLHYTDMDELCQWVYNQRKNKVVYLHLLQSGKLHVFLQ